MITAKDLPKETPNPQQIIDELILRHVSKNISYVQLAALHNKWHVKAVGVWIEKLKESAKENNTDAPIIIYDTRFMVHNDTNIIEAIGASKSVVMGLKGLIQLGSEKAASSVANALGSIFSWAGFIFNNPLNAGSAYDKLFAVVPKSLEDITREEFIEIVGETHSQQ